jgi:hypothetical protein
MENSKTFAAPATKFLRGNSFEIGGRPQNATAY